MKYITVSKFFHLAVGRACKLMVGRTALSFIVGLKKKGDS